MSLPDRAIRERRRRTHRTLIGIILATLPCYFCGIVLLVGFSGEAPPTPTATFTGIPVTATPSDTPTSTPTITPTITPGGPTLTLPATPTQFFPPTNTPTPDLNATATTNALLTQGAYLLTQTAQAATANAIATATANALATGTAQAALTATAGANRPPRAVRDSATTLMNTPVSINVLTNDSDPDGDPIAISSFDAVSAQGGVVMCTTSTCTYTPPTGFVGEDTFRYTISDGRGGSDSARVTVTVTAPPTSTPTATATHTPTATQETATP